MFSRIVNAEKWLAMDQVWPETVEPEAKALITALLVSTAPDRLGAGALRGERPFEKHAWFAKHKFDWRQHSDRKLTAPFVPSIKDALDTSNFSSVEDEDVDEYDGPQDEFADWSDGFVTFAPTPKRDLTDMDWFDPVNVSGSTM